MDVVPGESASGEDSAQTSPRPVATARVSSSIGSSLASDTMSIASRGSRESSHSGSKLNISVLCPSCNASIALDLPFLMFADGYDTSRPASTRHVGSNTDSEEESTSSDYESPTNSDDEMLGDSLDDEEYQRLRRQRKREHRRDRHHSRKQAVKELQQKVERLSAQAANSAGRASDLQDQLERVKRKSSMLRLSTQSQVAPLSMPAPPRMSQAVSSPIITTPIRHVSASAVDAMLSHSRSTTSMQQLQQQQQEQSQQSGGGGALMGLFSLARTVSSIPFSIISSSSFLPIGYMGGIAPTGASPSQGAPNGQNSSVLSTSSSSSTSSTISYNTTSTSSTSLSSLANPASSPTSSSSEHLINTLQLSVQRERQLREAAELKTKQVGLEIEELSQSLFEEANKMVSVERRARAKAEVEAQQARAREEKLLVRVAALEKMVSQMIKVRSGAVVPEDGAVQAETDEIVLSNAE